MKTVEISGRTCHIIINGAELPTIYCGEMKNSSETIEKVLALCEDVKCNYIVYEVEDLRLLTVGVHSQQKDVILRRWT